jgi:hypothetical protein
MLKTLKHKCPVTKMRLAAPRTYNVNVPHKINNKVASLTLTLTLNLRQHHSLQEWHNGTDNGKS